MRICIPTRDDAGRNSQVHGHVGSAPYYAICDVESATIQMIPNAHAQHRSGACGVAARIGRHRVDAVVCAGMGRRALQSMEEAGIEVYLCDQCAVEEVLLQVASGALPHLSLDEACQGHHGGCHES